jgi:hypothetical protein
MPSERSVVVQKAIRRSLIPTVAGTKVRFEPGPRYNGVFSYWESDVNKEDYDTVYWIPIWHGHRDIGDLQHEFAHALDGKLLTWDDRHALMRFFGGPERSWFWDNRDPSKDSDLPDPCCEEFAIRCAVAALRPDHQMKLRRWLWKVAKERQWKEKGLIY